MCVFNTLQPREKIFVIHGVLCLSNLSAIGRYTPSPATAVFKSEGGWKRVRRSHYTTVTPAARSTAELNSPLACFLVHICVPDLGQCALSYNKLKPFESRPVVEARKDAGLQAVYIRIYTGARTTEGMLPTKVGEEAVEGPL